MNVFEQTLSPSIIRCSDIDSLIEDQKSAIRMFTFFAVIIVLIGVAVVVVTGLFAPNDTVKMVANLGGGLIATASSFPLKEIITRREKIGTFRILREQILVVTTSEIAVSDGDRERIRELVWKVLEKTALG